MLFRSVSFTKLFALPVVALALASQAAASALPLSLEKRDIWSPQVLYPHEGTTWYYGQKHNVTWCAFLPQWASKLRLTVDSTQGHLEPAAEHQR